MLKFFIVTGSMLIASAVSVGAASNDDPFSNLVVGKFEKAGDCKRPDNAYIRIEEEGRADWGWLNAGQIKYFITPQRRQKFGWRCQHGKEQTFDCGFAPKDVEAVFSLPGRVTFTCYKKKL